MTGSKKEIPQIPPIPKYSNIAKITHTPYEFIFDFGVNIPEEPNKVFVHSRISMSPQHAQALLNALKENLGRYKKMSQNFPPKDDDSESRR